jgi:hypothetical protein
VRVNLKLKKMIIINTLFGILGSNCGDSEHCLLGCGAVVEICQRFGGA